jgi:hypothetical protein
MMPKPMLFTPSGKNVGELQMNYPEDPPHELMAVFKNWVHGFPQRVELRIKSPTASGGQRLAPLIWNQASGKYARGQ